MKITVKANSMSIPPYVVASARLGWKWQWNQLMNGLAPVDKDGNYQRPISQHQKSSVPNIESITKRAPENLPHLIVGRSCPWAHRTWLIYKLRNLKSNLTLLVAHADHKAGRWVLNPPWLGCDSLLDLYKACGTPPSHRATVPVIIDPGQEKPYRPKILGNESAQLVETLNDWPAPKEAPNLAPSKLREEIYNWQKLLQPTVNNGVYRCGFARNQAAYERASNDLFGALNEVEKSLTSKGPWLCGEQLTIADLRLFPTMIRWEVVYMPLFGCSKHPLWHFPKVWEWRQRLMAFPSVSETCDSLSWREDYFGALFPLNPSGIVPSGPDLVKMVNASMPQLR